MPDLIYVLMTLVAFALLALLVGRLDRRLDDEPTEPSGPAEPVPSAEAPREAAGR